MDHILSKIKTIKLLQKILEKKCIIGVSKYFIVKIVQNINEEMNDILHFISVKFG